MLLQSRYYINYEKPLDKRMIANKLSTVNTEIPLDRRYAGMIIYMRDMNTLYWLDGDMYTWHRLLPLDYNAINEKLNEIVNKLD